MYFVFHVKDERILYKAINRSSERMSIKIQFENNLKTYNLREPFAPDIFDNLLKVRKSAEVKVIKDSPDWIPFFSTNIYFRFFKDCSFLLKDIPGKRKRFNWHLHFTESQCIKIS
jgi:hypothetical protein